MACEFILDMLKADGEITVVPDPSGDATAARKKSKSAAKKKPATGAKGQAPDRREGQAQDALEVEPCLHRRSTGGHTVPNQQGGRGSSLNRISLTETSLF